MIPVNDLVQIAQDRLAYQYRDSTKLKALIDLLVGEVVLIRDAIVTMESIRRIDTAEGDGLDIIGEILGQPRELWGIVALEFFALHDGLGGPAAEGFGDLSDASAGRRFRSVNEAEAANRALGDSEYRKLLHAKVLRNRSQARPEDIIDSIHAVLGETTEVVIAIASSTVDATVQRILSDEEIAILNAETGIRGQIPVIPRPVGIPLTVAGL